MSSVKHKGVSIQVKVVAWFAVCVILISVLAMVAVLSTSHTLAQSGMEQDLRSAVLEFAEELYWSGDIIRAEDSFYEDNIVFSVYDDGGVRIAGSVPSDFPAGSTLKSGQIQKISGSGYEWLTYDAVLNNSAGEHIWIRGILYTGWVAWTGNGILLLACVGFVVLIALAVGGGALITRRAFAPVEYIRSTAADIARSGDLTRRVPTHKAGGELRELADTFNDMLDALQQSFEDEKQFTSDVSHELRTPVSVILAQGEYALLEDTAEQDRRHALTVILEQAKRMSALIAQMLFLARQERGLHEPEEWVDLGMAAQIAAEEWTDRAEQKGISVTSETEEGIFVRADQTGIMRIAVNLIENAVEYGRMGGHVWVKVYRDGERAMLCVQDDGMGIAPEHLPHIFKRFYRADAARTSDDKNHTGLGLAMVRTLTEAYGGTVSAQSIPGNTIFTVCLPVRK